MENEEEVFNEERELIAIEDYSQRLVFDYNQGSLI